MHESAVERRDATRRGLWRCLVEGDAAAAARSRRRRCQVLLISLAVQAGLLAALVLVPLVATSERVFALRMTPLPPYRGSPQANLRAKPGTSRPRHTTVVSPTPYFQFNHPPRVPHPAQSIRADSEGIKNLGLAVGPAWGIPDGVIPSGTARDTGWIPQSPVVVRPPADTQKGRVLRSQGVQQALLTQWVQPVYPPLAVQMHLEGTVQLHAIIGLDGAVTSLEVLSGHPILARTAREAARQWRYRPTLLNGNPVEVETYITVIFQLQR